MSFEDDFQDLKIPLEVVLKATNNFEDKPIGIGGFGKVYKGVLQEGQSIVAFKRLDRQSWQGDVEFWKEIMMLSKYTHENLVSLLHFCNDDVERILVYEYATNGSLDHHLGDPSLTWAQRLQICLGAAHGLKYLHDHKKGQQRVLHRDIKSANILLDDKWNAKVSDFGLSKIGPANQSCTYLFSTVAGTHGYCDPLYSQSNILSKESDVYSFGVVLFEVMCGKLCYRYHNEATIILVHHWQEFYDKNRLTDIIYHDLKEKKDHESLKTFSALANRCLSLQRRKRPTMVEIVKELELALQQENSCQDKPNVVKTTTTYQFKEEFDYLKIQLQEILLATDNFSAARLIGRGGYGSVYKGKSCRSKAQSLSAFKRLDGRYGQGHRELWNEIMILSKHNHENLVSLIGFCDEAEEGILMYEYVSRGSLDRHLSNTSLTWTQRLKICIGVARALNHLHDPIEIEQRILHQDLKSLNILLDENWTAKVSGFGLSTIFPTNQPHTYLKSDVVGTPGYLDPLYMETGLLSTKSDVYSFGVVLFEVMCGRLCIKFNKDNQTNLVPGWKQSYDEKRVDEIILHDLKEQMEPSSLNTFSAIAYKCLNNSDKKRPSMAKIVTELEIALAQQEVFEELKRIVDLVVPPSSYTSQSDRLSSLLMNGLLVQDGKTWVSINQNRRTHEMIAAIKSITGDSLLPQTIQDSRFSNVLSGIMHNGFRVEVRTRFLLPRITYTINLVFKHNGTDQGAHVPFKFKFHANRHYSNLSIGHVREDGWMMIELCRFTSYKQEHEFKIDFMPVIDISFSHIQYFLEGVEFRPLEYVN